MGTNECLKCEVNVSVRSVQAVLRVLADAAAPRSDADLLRRYAAERSDAAFAELVRRHGRLVWAVCRSQSRDDAEADDAFQATFLVLIRNANKIRDGGKLSAWLHGVAFKVCSKARASAKRRATREAVAANHERNGHVVSESGWDRALAAVHEEVAKLPEALRVPFVMCCLEGKGVTEAAAQVGWKLGTFSGRLTRAKDAVLARLDSRGLTLAVVAGVGLAIPPLRAVAKTTAMARAGYVIPSSIHYLSQGVIGMSAKPVKLLIATVAIACSLGLSVGGGWLATAEAQERPSKADPQAEIQRLKAELDRALKQAADQAEVARAAERAARLEAEHLAAQQKFLNDQLALTGERRKEDSYTAKTAKWEYDFVVISAMDQTRFMKFLQDRENRGWEYNGTTKFVDPASECWIFRRPAKSAVKYREDVPLKTGQPNNAFTPATSSALTNREYAPLKTGQSTNAFTPATNPTISRPSMVEEAKAIEAEIVKLQARLSELKGARTTFSKSDSPLDPPELANLLQKLASKQLKAGHIKITHSADEVIVEGDQEAREWASGVVKRLSGK